MVGKWLQHSMDKEIIFDYKIEEFSLANAPYPKKEIEKYDYDKCYKKVKEKVKEFRLSYHEYPNIPKPKITPSYEVRYECFLPTKIDKVGKYIEQKVDEEIHIKKLYSLFVQAFSLLNKNEYSYLFNCLFFDKSENSIIKDLDITRFKFNEIRESCIIKVAKTLGVAVLKE